MSFIHIQPHRNFCQYAQNQAQTQPGEVRLWGNRRQSVGLSSIHIGHRGQPQQNKSDSPNATTTDKKRGAEIDMPHSSIEQVRCEAGAEKFTFFSVLCGSTKVEWGPEHQKAFDDLKQYLQHLLTLPSPEQGQPPILYISATHTVVSGALVVLKEVAQGAGVVAKHQHPVYFISKVLAESKKYYSEIKKICYAVVMCSRKLRHYFEAHTIRVLMNQPLHDIFGNRDSFGRIRKWAIELSEYVINFKRHSAINSQILADFMAKWMEPQSQADIIQESPWLVHCDGAWGNTRAGAAAILTSPSGIKLRYAARLQFTGETDKCTNHIKLSCWASEN
jgi:hypothetical protein